MTKKGNVLKKDTMNLTKPQIKKAKELLKALCNKGSGHLSGEIPFLYQDKRELGYEGAKPLSKIIENQ